MRARVGAGMLLVGGIVAASFFWLREPPAPPDQSADLPASPSPLFAIPRPVLLKETRPVARWSTVLHELRPRATPFWGSPAAALLERTTPEGTANVVLVHRTATDPKGRLWVRISLPGLPGETRGWVPRPALGAYHAVRTHLVVDLERLTATLRRDGRSVLHVPVGIGSPSWPTPRGEFYVRNRLTRFASPFYGPLAFGTSARSTSVTDWPGGGFIGIHGTSEPELLPGRVSHGCIRMRNEDILRLGRLMPIGTPVSIR